MQATSLEADREKRQAALTSVLAAVGLTLFKIIVGLLTGSLGILAEASHSGLDLVAALVTFFAVQISGRPADMSHNYGHGKVENLSALFETLLLLATCVWIIYEAIQRLFFKHVTVDISIWAFIVMFAAIGIDYTRSRILYKTAVKHNSQALEADALHFRTDIWSSSVVIFGLALVKIGELVPRLAFLHNADAIAAMGVAGIVIFVSLELGSRTVHGLLDAAPAGAAERVREAVEMVPGVLNAHHVRLRYSGPQLFVDVHILVNPDKTVIEAHDLTMLVEKAITNIFPGADVTVHPEPAGRQESFLP